LVRFWVYCKCSTTDVVQNCAQNTLNISNRLLVKQIWEVLRWVVVRAVLLIHLNVAVFVVEVGLPTQSGQVTMAKRARVLGFDLPLSVHYS